MANIRLAVFLIGSGLTLGFTLVVYAHSSFATKSTIQRIEQGQKDKDGLIIKRLDRIESKLDKIIYH